MSWWSIVEGWAASFTPNGTLAVGLHGAKRLVDPDTLTDVVALPQAEAQSLATIEWTQDYRYAAVGNYGGRSFCP